MLNVAQEGFYTAVFPKEASAAAARSASHVRIAAVRIGGIPLGGVQLSAPWLRRTGTRRYPQS